MFNHIIQELITKAIEKQAEKIITKKTSKQIQKDANTFNKPHLFVSGYYQAYAFLFACPILIIVLLLCIFIQFQIHHFDMVTLCCILIIFLLYITYKRVHKMYLLAYWQAGLTFYDRKGNQLVQIPSSYLKNATSKHEIIQNALVTFLLELSNIWIENHWNLLDEPYQIRYEYILKRFFDSLMQNYRREHLVPFYADQLNITTQYLSSVIKSLTGRTPSQFIFERLYCEARALLDHPDLSIKEIAELLHFSDQSAFGKFFKKRYGQSPVDYRKRHPI